MEKCNLGQLIKEQNKVFHFAMWILLTSRFNTWYVWFCFDLVTKKEEK